MTRTLARLLVLVILTVGLTGRSAPRTLRATLVGVVLPADRRPNEKVSGSVTLNPKAYAEMPAVQIVEATVPLEVDEAGNASLEGLVVDMPGAPQTPAGSPLVFTVPEQRGVVPVTVRREEDPKQGVAVPVQPPAGGFVEEIPVPRPTPATSTEPTPPKTTEPTPPRTTEPVKPNSTYDTPAVTTAGGTGVVRGPFRGDGRKTRVSIDGLEAPIVCETPRAVYFQVPKTLKPGRHRILVKEGSVLVLLPVTVARLDLGADRLELLRGETTKFHTSVSGPETMSDGEWKAGPASPLVSPASVSKASTFRAPKKGEPGAFLFTLENASAKTITIDELPSGYTAKSLDRAAFAAGAYRMDGTIRSIQSGRFNVHAVLIPFLEFPQGEGLTAENCGGPDDSSVADEGLPLPSKETVEKRRAAERMRALKKAREAADDAEEIARRLKERKTPSPDAEEAAKALREKADQMAKGMSKDEVAKVAEEQAKEADQIAKWREESAANARKKAAQYPSIPEIGQQYEKDARGYTCEAERAKKKAEELHKEARRLGEGAH